MEGTVWGYTYDAFLQQSYIFVYEIGPSLNNETKC
jgi:hypothetical protein